jgi:hypothetical protein
VFYPGASAPCPGLKLTADGNQTYCEVVSTEAKLGFPPRVARNLGIGEGCSMPDTTTAQRNFHERFNIKK